MSILRIILFYAYFMGGSSNQYVTVTVNTRMQDEEAVLYP